MVLPPLPLVLPEESLEEVAAFQEHCASSSPRALSHKKLSLPPFPACPSDAVVREFNRLDIGRVRRNKFFMKKTHSSRLKFPSTTRFRQWLRLGAVAISSSSVLHAEAAGEYPLAGADEATPSRSHYFSWVDNTNEGSTEKQTLTNLDFFKWLHDDYGMALDIYALDAGAIDTPGGYGSMDSERFKKQFPNGFGPLAAKAKSFDCRLGVWLGPDGFGDTPEQEKARTDMLVKLCRDFNFHLFKVDAVCGQLRPEKQQAFVKMLKECRKYCPDLIVLNHRLDLGEGEAHTTTHLWAGEAYIDVWRGNEGTGTHNRVGAIELGVPVDGSGKPKRLVEDHGVCLSSCLDFWEDDLVLQALSRNLILAPELYGSPWLLRDDEFPKLARIYNLTRRYRDILTNGMMLDEKNYGPKSVSRGNEKTRIVTLQNTTWNPVTYKVTLDGSIGIGGSGPYEVRRLHPAESLLGTFKKGETFNVTVLPFRSHAMIISSEPSAELGVDGCAYEVVRDVPGKPATLQLLGMAGTTAKVSLPKQPRKFSKATLGGQSAPDLIAGKTVEVKFPGTPLKQAFHRKLADLATVAVPQDAAALYEATCFAADNNAMEIRSLARSGPTAIPQVQASRAAFLGQKLLTERGVWDHFLFDNDPNTFFRLSQNPIWDGALRIDTGKPIKIDQWVLRNVDATFKPEKAYVSADLKSWTEVPIKIEAETPGEASVLKDAFSGTKEFQTIQVNRLTLDLPASAQTVRYLKIPGTAKNVGEVTASLMGKAVERGGWRASNVFADYLKAPAKLAWSASFKLTEAAKGSYLVVPCIGKHGQDGAYAALRMNGRWIGAPQRAKGYPANPWETGNGRPDQNFSYFFPVTPDMIGKTLDAVVLQFDSQGNTKIPLGEFKSEVWITTYPIPYVAKQLVLEE